MILSRRDIARCGLAGFALTLAAPTRLAARAVKPAPARTSFRPGEAWTDTAGKPIQAHGGALIHVDGVFYWYGENKEFTTGKNTPQSWGIRIYRSADLYNWEDLGLLIPPDRSSAKGPLSPSVLAERPHILYNQRTRKFVCWIKIRGLGPEHRIVLTADRITGPYTLMRDALRPVGMVAGDYDMTVSADDGKGYIYFEHAHKEVVCADLTDDYLDTTGNYSTHFPRQVPLVREGLAYFTRKGKHYLTSSGMTGYYPNPSEVAVADMYHGPFEILGDLHPQDRSRSSYNSQISQIFKHPGKADLYIALADRWLPDLGGAEFDSGRDYERIVSGLAKVMGGPGPQSLTKEEIKVLARVSVLSGLDTSVSRYVWLPVTFEGARPVIHWHDEWTIETFR